MEIKGRFDHFNFNVLDLEKSIRFYEKALGLKEVRRKTASDGSFILVYMGDGETSFTLELTWLQLIGKNLTTGRRRVSPLPACPGRL